MGPRLPGPIDLLPAPADSCRSFCQDPASTPNWAGFCDPHLDNLASQTQAAQVTDPAAARSRWTQVDRIAADQAPYVPVYNDAGAIFVSSRVANYQASPLYGPPARPDVGPVAASLNGVAAGPAPVPTARLAAPSAGAGSSMHARRRKPPRAHLVPSAVDHDGSPYLTLRCQMSPCCGRRMPRSRASWPLNRRRLISGPSSHNDRVWTGQSLIGTEPYCRAIRRSRSA
jgi:hypothetical protein